MTVMVESNVPYVSSLFYIFFMGWFLMVMFHFKGMPEYTSEIQQRRLDKLETLRRRGKGPPKKGSGKRKK